MFVCPSVLLTFEFISILIYVMESLNFKKNLISYLEAGFSFDLKRNFMGRFLISTFDIFKNHIGYTQADILFILH